MPKNHHLQDYRKVQKVDYLLLAFTSLFFLNLFGYYLYVGIFLFLFVVSKRSKYFLTLTTIDILLLLFGFTYVLFGVFNTGFKINSLFTYVILPWFVFNLGRLNIIGILDERKVLLLLLIFSVSISILYLFPVLLEFYRYGYVGYRMNASSALFGRTGKDIEISATLVGMHYTPLLSFLPIYLFGNKGLKNDLLILGSVLTLLAIFATLLIMTRTELGIFVLLLLFVFVYNFNVQSWLKKIAMFLIISVSIFYFFNTDFSSIDITSGMYERFQSADVREFGSRTDMWIAGLKNSISYPFGGEKMYYSFYHNLWLDVRKVGGLIPMIILIIFSIKSVTLITSTLKNSAISIQTRSLIGSMFLAIFTVLFMEPVIEGSYIFLLYFIFFIGFIFQYQKNINNRVNRINV